MSTRSLAIFLHRLLAGALEPVGPVSDSATLTRLVEQPAPVLQTLLGAHVDALIGGWPDGALLRPRTLPATALWAATALNNLVWALQRPDPRLLTVTLRLAQALPAATDPATALAYHSLLRHLDRLELASDWLPVARLLVARSPLTAAWLPRREEQLSPVLLDLLRQPPVQVALRDRWLGLLPDLAAVRRTVSLECATANAELGSLLGALLEHNAEWQPLALAFYEADCLLQRQGSREQPTWPGVTALGTAARYGADARQRRHAERVLARYRPLVALLADEALVRPYLHLDGRFLMLVADMMPHVRLKLRRMPSDRIADSR